MYPGSTSAYPFLFSLISVDREIACSTRLPAACRSLVAFFPHSFFLLDGEGGLLNHLERCCRDACWSGGDTSRVIKSSRICSKGTRRGIDETRLESKIRIVDKFIARFFLEQTDAYLKCPSLWIEFQLHIRYFFFFFFRWKFGLLLGDVRALSISRNDYRKYGSPFPRLISKRDKMNRRSSVYSRWRCKDKGISKNSRYAIPRNLLLAVG